jgi:protein-tyrosine phosphatase
LFAKCSSEVHWRVAGADIHVVRFIDVGSSIVDVSVGVDADGAFEVDWSLSGDDVDVDIALGPTPASIDHIHVITVPAGNRSVRIEHLGPGRHYVSVARHGGGDAVVAAERRVSFEGVTNFRDLGGYLTSVGRTRWGLVFRSDALHRFTEMDLVGYGQLGVRAVYDLRGDVERERGPNPVPSTHLPVLGRPVSEGVSPPADRTQLRVAADGEGMLREMYGGILANAGMVLGQLLEALADPTALPAVFHCTGGKDRTGMAAALLLELLGVSRQDVLDDYELTARYRTRIHQTGSYESLMASGMAPEAAAAVLGTPRWAMEATLDVLDTRYGGVEAYLLGPAGMTPSVLARLRDLLVS